MIRARHGDHEERGGCRDQDIPSMVAIDFAEWFSCLTRLHDFLAFAGNHSTMSFDGQRHKIDFFNPLMLAVLLRRCSI